MYNDHEYTGAKYKKRRVNPFGRCIDSSNIQTASQNRNYKCMEQHTKQTRDILGGVNYANECIFRSFYSSIYIV